MSSYADTFINIMHNNDVPPPKEDIIEDGQLQIYCENEMSCWCILDTKKPAVGLYGRCDGSIRKRWAP